MTPRLAFGLGLWLAATPALAAREVLDQDVGVEAWANLEDKTNDIYWRAFFDVPPERAVARLTRWGEQAALIQDAINEKVHASTASTARISFERKTPLFLPNLEVTMDVVVKTRPDGGAEIKWTQVEGMAKAMERTLVIAPAEGGCVISQRMHVETPFAPPAFLVGDPRDKVRHDLDAMKRALGATTVKTPPRKARVP